MSDRYEQAVADSGCTSHLLKSSSPCLDKIPTSHGLRVGIPNGEIMTASHNAQFDFSHLPIDLPAASRTATVHPTLQSKALLSLGQLCDHGCDHVLLDKKYVSVIIDGVTSVIGQRDPGTGLWFVDMHPNRPGTALPKQHPSYRHHAHNAYALKTKTELIDFLHRASFSPSVSTWTQAIDSNFFASWPGLTADAVRKFLPKSLATAKGHLKATRKHQRSTKIPPLPQPASTVMTTPPAPPKHGVRTHLVYATVTGQIFTDQTGRFPVVSSKGNKYVMVLYDYDSNAILAEPIKSRHQAELVRAYQKMHTYLTERGLKPRLQKLDNECPEALKQFMRAEDINFQLVPPYDHRQNSAERAIGTWKDHFVAGLASLDPNFPMHLWCRLIPQCNQTLNLLRQSRLNPRLSAEAQLNGVFDYNKTPLAPPGTKILIHETPNRRKTWAVHGVDGWYIGGAPEHYRCYKVYATKTRAERIARTVEFFPHYGAMPKLSSVDAAVRAAIDLCWALRHPAPSSALPSVGDEQLAAITQLSDIFSRTLHSNAPSDLNTAPTASPPRVLFQAPSTPVPPIVAPPRVGTPTSRVQTRVPFSSLRQSTMQSPRLSVPGPALIAPDLDDPVLHRYPTRSRHVPFAHHASPLTMSAPTVPTVRQQSSAFSVIDGTTGASLSYRHLIRGPDKALWMNSMANDLGRLAQGVGTRISGTNTIFFIPRHKIPSGRKVTYCKQEASIRPNKAETHRVRNCAGGDRLDYPGPTATQCASLVTIKLLLNSTISTPNARFTCFDIKNFYYGTPMQRYEYMKMHLSFFPDEIITQYDLHNIKDSHGWIHMEIRKGMPGLKQAGRIANDRLTKHLAQFGYTPVERTPSLWTHRTRPITFSLVVDDFGVKYVGRTHADHLLKSLQQLYVVTEDNTGSLFHGLTIEWNYSDRYVDISMPKYVPAMLHKYQHPKPRRRQDAPHAWAQPTYGAKVQFATDDDSSPVLTPAELTRIQQVVGTLLYYAISVDPTMLVALGSIASTQAKATKLTQDECLWVLDYAASNPDAKIRYHASGMVLYIHSDASYLSETRGRSRAGGHFFLSTSPTDPTAPPLTIPPLNGPVHTVSKILDVVVGSAAEAEIAGTYLNAQDAVSLRTTLQELQHPQPPTPMQVDNTTAAGFANQTMKQKRSKAMDMRFHWIKDRVRQKQFLVYYRPGITNLADPFTKHHSPTNMRLMRSKFLQPSSSNLAHTAYSHLVRGCVNSPLRARARAQGISHSQARNPTNPTNWLSRFFTTAQQYSSRYANTSLAH